MRRKIEKYLAKIRGCEPDDIEPAEDGRYEFYGDFDGVLAAVRGSEPPSTDGKKKISSSDRRAAIAKKGTSNGLPMPYYHYTPYMPPPGMYPHHPMMGHILHNRSHPFTPWANPADRDTRPPTPPAARAGSGVGTPLPALDDPAPYGEGNLSTVKKTVFDYSFGSPQPRSSSPVPMSIQGMTPPLSCLKDIFATPGPLELLRRSPDVGMSLNKSLFTDGSSSLTPFAKTPGPKDQSPIKPIRISMTGENDNSTLILNMRLGGQVGISPLQKRSSQPFVFSDEGTFQKESTSEFVDSDQQMMPPPAFSRPKEVLSSRKSSQSDDMFSMSLDSSEQTPRPISQTLSPKLTGSITKSNHVVKHLAATPSTAATVEQSFWSDQIDMSPVPTLSPFQTPSVGIKTEHDGIVSHGESTKKVRPCDSVDACHPSKRRKEDLSNQ
jgi:hypothetical protein